MKKKNRNEMTTEEIEKSEASLKRASEWYQKNKKLVARKRLERLMESETCELKKEIYQLKLILLQ